MMEVGYVAHYQRNNLALLQDPYSIDNATDYPNTDEAVAPEMMTLLDKEAPFISQTVARLARLFRG